jgi:hypothetical protein
MIRTTFASLTIAWIFTAAVLTQQADSDGFDRRVYAIHQLKYFSSAQEKFASLTAGDRNNILGARSVVIQLLEAVNGNRSGVRYLTPTFASKVPSPEKLAGSLVDPETVLLAVSVSDYDLDNAGKSIHLDMVVVSHSEGEFSISEMGVSLKKPGMEWKIDELRISK